MNTVRVSLPLTQSPSSVRWHSDAMMQHKTTGSDAWLWQQDEVPDNELSEAWKTPDAIEMHRRLRFRRTIREETLQHRRIHRHGGIVAGRNIALALRDRECYGGHVYNHKHIAAVAGVSAVAVAGASAGTTPGNVASTMPSSTTQATGDKSKRQLCPFPGTITEEIRTFAEYCSVVRYHSAFLHHLGGNDDIVNGQRPSSSQAVSTISVAFSPDAQTMASTHGDHTIKITSTNTGNLLQTLDGHPRTPWTVKYHPLDPNILASGCLGHQVRLWNWKTAACLHMIRLEFAIISLSFHPQGSVLAIANGTRLHFWSLDGLLETNIHSKTNANSNNTNTKKTPDEQLQQRRGILTEVEQRHMLRCVHFHPEGKSIIVGGVNATPERSRRVGNLTFYLRLFDFDLALALRPAENPSGGYRRRVISNPRTFVPRALLYNDGGFDISPDGKTLCACAEYWLPEGVENAMDLLYPNTTTANGDEEQSSDDESIMNQPQRTNNCTHEEESNNLENPRNPSDVPPHTTSSPPRSGNPPPSHPAAISTLPNSSLTFSLAIRGNPLTPQTPPPRIIRSQVPLSPPSPPGRRFAGGLSRINLQQNSQSTHMQDTNGIVSGDNASGVSNPTARTTFFPPPPPPPPGMQHNRGSQDAFSMMTRILDGSNSTSGRFVPHVVTISLDTSPIGNDALKVSSSPTCPAAKIPKHTRPRLGQLLEACPLDGAKASAVTCVKFSPSTSFCLIGYGVREPLVEHNGNQYHPVTALYRVRGGMTHVSTMLSSDDDVNIARFHPESGSGFVYGTKQGRVRVLSPRPWNFYNC